MTEDSCVVSDCLRFATASNSTTPARSAPVGCILRACTNDTAAFLAFESADDGLFMFPIELEWSITTMTSTTPAAQLYWMFLVLAALVPPSPSLIWNCTVRVAVGG